MSQQYINIGSEANDGNGDPIRTAFQKTNDNFTQLFTGAGNITGNSISVSGNITANIVIGNSAHLKSLYNNGNIQIETSGNTIWNFDTTGNLTVPGNVLIPTGQLSVTGNTNATAIVIGNGAVNNCAIAMIPDVGTAGQFAFRDFSTANSTMYFDTTVGSANIGGQFIFRGSNSFAEYAKFNQFGISTTGNVDAGAFYTNTGNITTGAGLIKGPNLEITHQVVFSGPYGNALINNYANISTSGNVISATTVVSPVALGNLTAIAGGRAFINNSNLVASGNFGALASAGGSNTVPVWSDGTNWYIG